MSEKDTSRVYWGLTEDELLHSRLLYARLSEIMAKENVTLRYAEVSTNVYGEFMFVTITTPAPGYYESGYELRCCLYGLGWHEYRNRVITHWEIGDISFQRIRDGENAIRFQDAMDRIGERHVEAKIIFAGEREKLAKEDRDWGDIFSQIADLTDDDAAWDMFSDYV